MISKLHKSNTQTIYIYMCLCTSKFHPSQHFLTSTPTKGRVFFFIYFFNLWKFWGRRLTYWCCSTHLLNWQWNETLFQLTGWPCLCLDLPFLPFEGLEGMLWALPRALQGRHGTLMSPLLRRSQHPQGETCPLPPQDTRIPVQPCRDPGSA